MDFQAIADWMHYGLEWIGFGTLVGLCAKAALPGKDGGGALATVIIGILGSLIGASMLAYFFEGASVKPISFLGFVVAMGGTTLLLVSYRFMGGGAGLLPWFPFKRGKRRATIIEEGA